MENSLDLCISFDDTGSMSSVRKQVKQNIISLVNSMMSGIPGLRIALICHNDYCDYPRHIFTMDFTRDINQIKRFVDQDSPCGGGDAPECYELALHEASKFDWRSDRRALILIGDEVPQPVGYTCRPWPGKNELDWRKEAAELKNIGVQVYGVQALGRRNATNFYTEISRITNGVKLDLSQFQHIPTYLNAVAYHQSGQLDTYENSDPTFKTNLALKNMFNKLRGVTDYPGSLSSEKIELLSKFQVMNVTEKRKIKDFVETMGCTYRKGRGFYQLIERTADGKANFELIQANKEVIFVDKATGEANADTYWCREQLGVPFGTKGNVRPLQLPEVMSKYDVFVQSNSYTRDLDPGTRFLYELESR